MIHKLVQHYSYCSFEWLGHHKATMPKRGKTKQSAKQKYSNEGDDGRSEGKEEIQDTNVAPKSQLQCSTPPRLPSEASEADSDKVKARPEAFASEQVDQEVKQRRRRKLSGTTGTPTVPSLNGVDPTETLLHENDEAFVWTFELDANYTACVVLLTITSLFTRFYRISQPPSVAWDETHFGKFANRYINREFYFDVHPPLAKMLIALAGYVGGYDGQFPFVKPGDEYGNAIYIPMRMLCAFAGALCVPLAYMTVRELVPSNLAGLLAASLVLFDTSCITISRFILLDPILMVFIHAAAWLTCRVTMQRSRSFGFMWWLELFGLGFALSGAMGSKWVGLFIVIFAGLYTIRDLWTLWGDITNSVGCLVSHFLSRATALIAAPVVLYCCYFWIHFAVCHNTGDGDSFMSSAFQSSLQGNALNVGEMPNHVAYGSIVTIKSARCGGGLLHSHPHLYPDTTIQQQQITGYQHRDDNNKWLIKRATPELDATAQVGVVEFVRSGDRIRLEHVMTGRNLHSHVYPSPLKPHHQQVTGYGEQGVGDAHDEWEIRLVNGRVGDRIGRISDAFMLVHGLPSERKCALHSDGTKLPEWGFSQLEVTCSYSMSGSATQWNFELHENKFLPNASVEASRPSFFHNLLELHIAMGEVNNGLIANPADNPSQAWHWPINYRGQRFTAWGPTDTRIYLMGNPVVYYINLLAIGLFLLILVFDMLMTKRQLKEPSFQVSYKSEMVFGSTAMLIGWALHYLPFFLMGRVLYFHHYMPALLFSCMLTGLVGDYVCRLIGNMTPHPHAVQWALASIILGVVLWGFKLFSCTSYGMTGPLEDMAQLMWQSEWELDH
eukprot:m.107474 g.107474  ORF g.107474 m.107474 type:complete len:836 (-) comp13323_c0_seq13:1556-4063(-)